MELAVEDHVLLEHAERAGKLFERRCFVVQFWETALDRFAACRQNSPRSCFAGGNP
jgi:hypothetical protein